MKTQNTSFNVPKGTKHGTHFRKHCDNGVKVIERTPISYLPSCMSSPCGKKDTPPLSPSPLPLVVARDFENQTKIGWLQALMVLLGNNWVEIQNFYIQSLGENTSGKRWISSLIRKMWCVAWDFCKFCNHTLHATEGPRKLEMIYIINKIVTHQLEKGVIGLLAWCHFLFRTSIHTLLTQPIQQLHPIWQPPLAQDDASAPTPT